jgi:hypothetical protein
MLLYKLIVSYRDLSFVVRSTDPTHAVKSLSFYSQIFGKIPSAAAKNYKDLNYGRIMMSKGLSMICITLFAKIVLSDLTLVFLSCSLLCPFGQFIEI